MAERDFEEASEGRRFIYEPKNRTEDPMKGKKGERLTAYYGPMLAPPAIEEIRVWSEVLMAIKDGIPKPYDSSIIVEKIIRLEKKTGEDFSELKNCCPPSGDVREAIQMKPFIFGILDRIVEIGEIEKYVDKYNNNYD